MVRREQEGSKSPYMKMHAEARRKQTLKIKREKEALNKAFDELGAIDEKHESKTYTKAQHDAKSKAVLAKLMKVK